MTATEAPPILHLFSYLPNALTQNLTPHTGGTDREEDISAQQQETPQQAWFPAPHEHRLGSGGAQPQATARPAAPGSIVRGSGGRAARRRDPQAAPWIQGELLWVRRIREGSGLILVVRRRLGGAVVRNRLRRRLRHICRDAGVTGLVVLAQPGAERMAFVGLRQELVRLYAMA